MTVPTQARDLARGGQKQARRAADSTAMHVLARTGLAACGVVYTVIAVLAIRVALGRQAQSADQKGALQQVSAEPFGRVALVVLALSFASYAVWRLSTVVTPEPGTGADSDTKQAARRIAALAQALIYGALCVTTVTLVAGSQGGASGAQKPAGWTSRLLGLPAGRALVLGVGIAVIAGGLALAVWALRQKFEERLMTEAMGPAVRRTAAGLGTAGNAARGLIFALVGGFLVKASLEYDAGQAKGLDDTLHSVAAQPYGTALLMFTAIGLLAFGAYSFVEARYRRL